jgi:hypothetical protein
MVIYKKWIPNNHKMFVDIPYNYKAGMKQWYHNMCLLTGVRFLSMLFRETTVLFYIIPHYVNFSCSHIWIIDKLDTKLNGIFLNMF